MNTDMESQPPMDQMPEPVRDVARQTADAAEETANKATAAAKEVNGAIGDLAGDVANAAAGATKRATTKAKDLYSAASLRAEDTVANSKAYVRRKPVAAILGALALGAVIGYAIAAARRKPTFGEQYAGEPLFAVRDAILGALTPVTDLALDGAGKVKDGVHKISAGRNGNSVSNKIGRLGSNLKFW